MAGRGHEGVGGRDAHPLIGVEEDFGRWYLVVRGWQGEIIGRLRCPTEEDARQVEEAFRTAMARFVPSPGWTTLDEARDWFDRMTDWEDAP